MVPPKSDTSSPVDVRVICGLTVIRKSADVDPAIVLPAARGTNPAVRRIEPDVCTSAR
jgi:hypothetical protein